ncbi:bifunctional riboflavin kinase/FAD synthetase [Prosthecobacter sp. SYSU 5D2]|uniref:bifunctional riboflavin kinase/FAD synthetase n=1 Tax=Prosthecobacter sp. SYSU 5D2 TaxID=3134134 RepID=UPI0031FE525F
MLQLRSIHELSQIPGPVSLAIGVFDGVHLGHQEVIRAAQEHAVQHHGQAVVMSFDPHPLSVLRPDMMPKRLCGEKLRARLLAEMGVAGTLLCPFTCEVAETSAEEFVRSLVAACRPLGCISVGYTWSFGKNRSGNIHSLMDLGQQHDFAVYGVPPIRLDGEVVSSTLIRDAVTVGDLVRAGALLGRPYSLLGQVIAGRQLARQLGFPTANVRPEAEVLPPFGVYAVQARIADDWRPGIANLGIRPTVESDVVAPALEIHVFDWEGDLYGQDVEVRMGTFLRPEKKFSGVEELLTQIRTDVTRARSLLSA